MGGGVGGGGGWGVNEVAGNSPTALPPSALRAERMCLMQTPRPSFSDLPKTAQNQT